MSTIFRSFALGTAVCGLGYLGGGLQIMEHAMYRIPQRDETALKGGDEVSRTPCSAIEGYDVVVREYLEQVQPQTEGSPSGLRKLLSIFDNEAYHRNSAPSVNDAHDRSYRSVEAGTRSGRHFSSNYTKFAALTLEPQRGASSAGVMKRLLDSSTHQSLVKCSTSRHAVGEDKWCVNDGDTLEAMYLRVMVCALGFFQNPLPTNLKICQIGVAAGSLPMFLQRHLPNRISTMDLVDVEPAMLQVARRFTDLRSLLPKPLGIHAADGHQYLVNCKTKYDLIFVDTFVGSDQPNHLKTHDFLSAVRSSLSRSGVAALNLPRNDSGMIHTCREVFGRDNVLVARVPKSSNVVVLATFTHREHMATRHLVQQCSEVSAENGLPFDVGFHLPLSWSVW